MFSEILILLYKKMAVLWFVWAILPIFFLAIVNAK